LSYGRRLESVPKSTGFSGAESKLSQKNCRL